MGDNEITGIDQLTFSVPGDWWYLTDVSSNYIELGYASTTAGGIIVIDGDGTTQGIYMLMVVQHLLLDC